MDAATQTPSAPGGLGPPKLEDQAATAALYVTSHKRQASTNSNKKSILDADNKLSSASAATSLKHANPRDLPSFPSAGLTNSQSSAGAAASLANANHRAFEYWKPEASASANKAAMGAKDYKAPDLWVPEQSAAGSKAALIAARSGSHVEIWKPSPSSAGGKAADSAFEKGGNVNIWRPTATQAGNKAADSALKNKNLSPVIDYGYTPDGRSRALMAATGALAGGRQRAGSSPIVTSAYPDSKNSAANALNAATVAHRPSTRSIQRSPERPGRTPMSQADATRIHNAAVTNLGREMYTSHPPVAPEVEEKNKQAALRGAAVVMAKQMYNIQQKALEQEAGLSRSDSHYAANSVHHRRLSSITSTSGEESVQAQTPQQYLNLQEAAQRLASERLAKLYDENAAYRDYYGQKPLQSRLSVRGRLRRRASSDGGLPDSDEAKSQQIRSQMSLFTNKVAEVDRAKQQKDRDALMAAAQRNVSKRMSGMDERIFSDTGKASPAMMAEWEAKARERAEADSSVRMTNFGKIHIGGGKYMDQSELDAIASKRVQPTLDEITEKAEAQRAEEERKRQEVEVEKARVDAIARSDRERDAKTKEEWKKFKDEEKRDAQAKKDEEKAKKVEEKRLREQAKEDERAKKTEERRLRDQEKLKSKISPPIPMENPDKKLSENAVDDGETPKPSNTETPVTTEEATERDTTGIPPEVPEHIDPSTAGSTKTKPVLASPTKKIGPAGETTEEPPLSPSKTEPGKLSSWFKSKLARRASKGRKDAEKPTGFKDEAAIAGVAAAAGATTGVVGIEGERDHDKEIDVPIVTSHPPPLNSNPPANTTSGVEQLPRRSSSRASSISSLSSDEPTTTTAVAQTENLEPARGRTQTRYSEVSALNPASPTNRGAALSLESIGSGGSMGATLSGPMKGMPAATPMSEKDVGGGIDSSDAAARVDSYPNKSLYDDDGEEPGNGDDDDDVDDGEEEWEKDSSDLEDSSDDDVNNVGEGRGTQNKSKSKDGALPIQRASTTSTSKNNTGADAEDEEGEDDDDDAFEEARDTFDPTKLGGLPPVLKDPAQPSLPSSSSLKKDERSGSVGSVGGGGGSGSGGSPSRRTTKFREEL
ncbi:hypothetical protein MMC25_002550 [Agyrium rufum]|nr:hypothetical protein [Agyrium rufum]